MNSLTLLLGFDMSCPPGSDAGDLAQWWDLRCKPVIDGLAACPSLRFHLHLDGPVIDFAVETRSASIEAIRAMVDAGRAEVLAGGFDDPPYGAIPERDATGQVTLLLKRIEKVFGKRPTAVRIPPGYWDPCIPRILGRAAIRCAVVSDLPDFPHPGNGWYMTEREGVALGLFGVDPTMQALDPSPGPEAALSKLAREAASGRSVVTWFFDPSTLDASFAAVLSALAEADHWLRTTTVSAQRDREPSSGAIYLSCAHAGPAPGAFEAGPWECVLARYDEANRLHKAMLRASREVDQLAASLRLDPGSSSRDVPGRDRGLETLGRARRRLYRAQSIQFCQSGGKGRIQDGNARNLAWSSVIDARCEVRRQLEVRKLFGLEQVDVDCDGATEIVAHTPHWEATVLPSRGGALSQLCSWRLSANLLNTLQRRREPWHRSMVENVPLPSLVDESDRRVSDGAEIEILEDDDDPSSRQSLFWSPRVTDQGVPAGNSQAAPRPPTTPRAMSAVLANDRLPRLSFLDHFLGPTATLRNLQSGCYPEQSDFASGEYALMRAERHADDQLVVQMARDGDVIEGRHRRLVRVVKRITFERDLPVLHVRYEVQNRYREPIHLLFAVEINLNLDSATTASRWFEIEARSRHPLDVPLEHPSVGKVAWTDEDRSIRVAIEVRPRARLWYFPVEDLFPSPAGLTLGFEGSCLMHAWPLDLWGEERSSIDFTFRLEGLSPARP
jgi:4-alpha-glucanotransferase